MTLELGNLITYSVKNYFVGFALIKIEVTVKIGNIMYSIWGIKMKRRLFLIISLVIMLFTFTGCSQFQMEVEKIGSILLTDEDSKEKNNDFPFEMETLYEDTFGGGFCLYRNTVTDVLYLFQWSNSRGGLTEMSDPVTGLPLTYERYLELYNE